LLIKSLKKLNRCENIVLLIFGSEHNDIDKLNIPHINYSKISDDQKLALIYSSADIFLLPSREDNLPNVMLESIACGTPVMAFAVGGAVDVIKDGKSGYLVQPYNTDDFSSKINEVLADGDTLTKMSIYCSKFGKENFSIERQAKTYLELFKELCKENSLNRDFQIDKNPTINIDRLGTLDSAFR